MIRSKFWPRVRLKFRTTGFPVLPTKLLVILAKYSFGIDSYCPGNLSGLPLQLQLEVLWFNIKLPSSSVASTPQFDFPISRTTKKKVLSLFSLLSLFLPSIAEDLRQSRHTFKYDPFMRWGLSNAPPFFL